MTWPVLANVTCVAVAGRGLLIEGAPGCGKSSLALALIDRGAALVGDDAIAIELRGARLWAHPPPNIAGRIEIRGVGIADLPAASAPLCLALRLGEDGARLPEPAKRVLAGATIPLLHLPSGADALRAEWALRLHGMPLA
jgi:HPr kinase/phosphorylase